MDIDDEPWRREVNSVPVETEDVRIERNGRTRRNDISKREESLRSKRESSEKKQIRDVSVGAPDTKESGCQTRESLFQTEPAVSSDGKILIVFYYRVYLILKYLLSNISFVVVKNYQKRG